MRKGGKTWIIVLIVLVALSLLGYIFSGETQGNVAHISVEGVIVTSSQSFFGDASSEKIVPLIQRAQEHPNVQAIVVEVNSPGGSAVASWEIGEALKQVDKPVVVYIRDAGASGGYWVASTADKIYASPLSLVGSVGVNAAQLEFAGLLENYNISYRQMTAGKYKDIGSPFRELSDDEYERLQTKIDDMHTYFLNEVQQNRNFSPEVMEEIRHADFYTGQQAMDLGLIDAYGGKKEAIAYIEEQIGEEAIIHTYAPERSFAELFASMGNVNLNIQGGLPELR